MFIVTLSMFHTICFTVCTEVIRIKKLFATSSYNLKGYVYRHLAAE